ncbi:protein phosphatase CheZ [Ferribacterium limneticum]|uniref:protein phosphatase CheZ n=1 Tax=Ferribacterium limneticum TaxID=76259 RepID=UPI001CFBCC61|nr:protein phosphatase CheZ [Ferribacterium limneticum]UCV27684.1 protein phosphatase CheZ [Ferribacterium limneticum]UCV31601.1 protein phosphatase CheZ [Ferribacterium limneticum]
MSANNDSDDLEALFDSIASDYTPAPVAPSAPVAPAPVVSTGSDSDDLQDLFDSVAAETQAEQALAQSSSDMAQAVSASGGDAWSQQEAVFNRIGHMARALHDTLGQLGYDKLLEKTVSALPDAKDRLTYVANLTEQAACRVLNATDIASPLVDDIENGARALGQRWDKVFANEMGPQDFKLLAAETRAYLNEQLPRKTRDTHAQLTEIMMAQDFQDLTGQVIKKVVSLAQDLESGLMTLLIEVVPETKRTEEVASLMNGPVINAEGRTDVVVNQEQVDDLLDSLGF